jgi:cytochrome oxidase Cu insertion factor (SCO1/SenC/PrrC family)
MRTFRLVMFLLVAFAAGGAISLMLNYQTRLPEPQTTGEALVGGPFSLINHKGERVTEQDFRGRLMLVFFGFTYCPDICPTELQTISRAMDELGPLADQVTPIFITVDPQRDTPQRMAEYVAHFGPHFVGLTGSEDETREAARAYRVYFAKVAEETPSEYYLMDHSAFTYLMDRNGKYVTHFSFGAPASAMASRIREQLAADKTTADLGAARTAQ